MKINIIAAFDPYCVIGVNGKLPFDIPEDLKRFQSLTMGHVVIMGRASWESLPVKPLPKRANIVVTSRFESVKSESGPVMLDDSISGAIQSAESLFGYEEAFVIGGSRPFREAMPLADTMYLTRIDKPVKFERGDTVSLFPIEDWRKERQNFDLDEVIYRDGYRFETWRRKV